MVNPERGGVAETAIHYGNYIDLGVMALGVATLNPTLFIIGAAGFGGGKVAENWLKNRREKV